MTDEERQKLVAWLCNPWGNYEELCRQAADELERLANAEAVWKGRAEAYLKIANDKAALAQSDAEPVAWQYRNEISKAIALGISGNKHPISIADDVLALLTAPPRPDASAGLIEAAEITSEWAGATSSLVEAHLLDALARELRARAAERSGK